MRRLFYVTFFFPPSSCRKLTKFTNWELATYEQALTAHRDRPGLIRVAQLRRLTQRSHRKGEQLQYILPKEEKVAVGVKEKVRKQVREQVQSDMPQLLQLLPLKRTGLWQPT